MVGTYLHLRIYGSQSLFQFFSARMDTYIDRHCVLQGKLLD